MEQVWSLAIRAAFFISLIVGFVSLPLTPLPALAANGQCKWEGGPGTGSGYEYCRAEDCIGQGGLAQCTTPVGAPPYPFEGRPLGPDNWVYHMCDEQPPHMAYVAAWCEAADGDWVVYPSTATDCINLPADILGGAGTITRDEERSVLISDNFARRSACAPVLQSDTGWGATIQSSFCGGGATTYNSGIPTREHRQRVYERTSCPGTLIISMFRDRDVKCPAPYKSRTRNGTLQCYIPANASCPVSNPVVPFSGAKLQVEVDFQSVSGAEVAFVRYFNSAGYYRPYGLTVSPVGSTGNVVHTDLWRHTYDRRLWTVAANSEVMAIVQREDGRVTSFDLNGREQANVDGAGDRLQLESGGTWKLTRANRSVERYSASGALQSIRSPEGQVTNLGYGSNGLLATVVGPFGHTLGFGYDAKGRLATLTLPDGSSTVQYEYDDYGRLIGASYPGGGTRQYHYEDARNIQLLTGITGESNQRYSTYTYDSSGRVKVSEHAGGADRYEFSYESANATKITDPAGASRTLTFGNVEGVYKTTSSTLPGAGCGIVKASTFDGNGNIASRTDFNNNQTHFTFDLDRNLEISRTDAFGSPRARTISTQWHATLRLPEYIDEPGRRTKMTYDDNGNVLTRTITDLATNQSRVWTYTYNGAGQVLTVDGPRTDVADVTTYAHHDCTYGAECGQVATVTNAAGHITTYLTYNAFGQPLTFTDANNVLTTLTYDLRQRLTSRETAGEITEFSYYPTGLLRRVTLPDDSYVEYSYDAAQRLIGIEDDEGNRISYLLDAAGNWTVENVYDPSQALARVRGAVFDTLSRLLSDMDAENNAIGYTYDLNGNVDSVTDPQLRLTSHAYDELNRLSSTIDPLQGLIEYAYTDRDELEAITDTRSLTTRYEYNGFGELKKLTSADTGVTSLSRDAAGNLHQSIDARNSIATYSYDALDRVTQVLFADQTIQYVYDQGANGKGRLTQLTDAAGTTHWTYTAQGRVASRQQVTGSVTRTVSYGYNTAGQLSQITTPSGQTLGYTYSSGKISGITVNGSPLLTNVVYIPFGPTSGWSWSNGTLAVREYDLNGRITTIDSAGLSTYRFNPDGTIQSWTEGNGAPLAGVTGLTEFDVDPNSNRLVGSDGAELRTYSYDAIGNIRGDGTRTFAYDSAGRMISATTSAGMATYALNGLGQRVRKSVGAQSTYFVYDEEGQLLGEYGANGGLIRETVWLGDIPVAVLTPNGAGGVNVHYIHTDHLNTPRRITRPADNAVVWQWTSDPFGASLANEDPDVDDVLFTYNLRFPGQYYDSETGLHYNYFRDYDASVGRYLQGDPIGLEGGINLYAYAGGDPISYIDPRGENPLLGALFSASTDILIQLAFNGWRLECIKWDVVLIAAAAGAVNPFSSFSAMSNVMKGQKMAARAGNLRKGSRAAKRTDQRADKHHRNGAREAASWAGIEGFAEGVGNMIPDEKHWRIGYVDPCEPCKK